MEQKLLLKLEKRYVWTFTDHQGFNPEKEYWMPLASGTRTQIDGFLNNQLSFDFSSGDIEEYRITDAKSTPNDRIRRMKS